METVKIRAIVFEHPEPQIFGKFCGYCPATNNFEGRGNSIKDCSYYNTQAFIFRFMS